MTVSFDDRTHIYIVDGAPWPSVTTVIQDSGYAEPGAQYYTTASQQRGNAGHKARELVDLHAPAARTMAEVDELLEVDQRLVGYVEGYLLFKRETGFVASMSETVVASKTLRVAGKFDIFGTIPGKNVLIDTKGWKAQAKEPKRHAVLQMAFYRRLIADHMQKTSDDEYILNLPGDGKYRMYSCKHTRTNDAMLVLEMVDLWWDKQRHGYVKIRGEK